MCVQNRETADVQSGQTTRSMTGNDMSLKSPVIQLMYKMKRRKKKNYMQITWHNQTKRRGGGKGVKLVCPDKQGRKIYIILKSRKVIVAPSARNILLWWRGFFFRGCATERSTHTLFSLSSVTKPHPHHLLLEP